MKLAIEAAISSPTATIEFDAIIPEMGIICDGTNLIAPDSTRTPSVTPVLTKMANNEMANAWSNPRPPFFRIPSRIEDNEAHHRQR